MANDYANEVLPRWQFWKEFLVEQLENYRDSVKKEHPKLLEVFDDEIVKKVEEAETAESLKQVSEEFFEIMWSLYKKFDDYEYQGVYATDVTNNDTLSSWVHMDNLIDKIRNRVE